MGRYAHTSIRKVKLKHNDTIVRKYDTTIYPDVPEDGNDTHVITEEGDRLDILAAQFYSDPKLWWFIAHVNNLNKLNIPAGTRLRIPNSIELARGD
tara:strand:- start:3175 stop:3462 length:288 start_codon:yes stop_codon:yes gene_type:complete